VPASAQQNELARFEPPYFGERDATNQFGLLNEKAPSSFPNIGQASYSEVVFALEGTPYAWSSSCKQCEAARAQLVFDAL